MISLKTPGRSRGIQSRTIPLSSNVYGESNQSRSNDSALQQQDSSSGDKNTIMQQINHFSLTPMNDYLAQKTIEDHKYLLEQVENKCAIAFFAAVNRNLSLYNALKAYITGKFEDQKVIDGEIEPTNNADGNKKSQNTEEDPLEILFLRIMTDYDFMSIVMYPELKNRREFVH